MLSAQFAVCYLLQSCFTLSRAFELEHLGYSVVERSIERGRRAFAKMGSSSRENICINLGEGSEVVYVPHFLSTARCVEWMKYLDQDIPWTRPSLFVYGRPFSQPRDICYVASEGLPVYKYSGYQPVVHSWDDHPPLKEILKAVHEALPGSVFNNLLLNRYKDGADYVGWHSDNVLLYGPTPTIATVTFGAEREFLIRKKKTGKTCKWEGGESASMAANTKETKGENKSKLREGKKRTLALTMSEESVGSSSINKTCGLDLSGSANTFQKLKAEQRDGQSRFSKDKYSFMLKHGSLFVMKGYTQRDWEHSIPKRMKIPGSRISLTFRCLLENSN